MLDPDPCRVAGLSLRFRARSSDTQEGFQNRATAPPLHREPAEVAQSSGQDASGVFRHVQPGDPNRPRTRWRDYISRLAWECLGILPEELVEVAGERVVWTSQRNPLLNDPDKKKKTNEQMNK